MTEYITLDWDINFKCCKHDQQAHTREVSLEEKTACTELGCNCREYNNMNDSVSYGILKRLVRMNRHLFGRVFVRASAHGNTHVKVELKEEWVPLYDNNAIKPTEELKFLIRSYLRDDPIRHRLDETRYLIEHENQFGINLPDWKPAGAGGTGRLWDYKIDGSMALDAGEWEEETF
jgi:hypothetical protein